MQSALHSRCSCSDKSTHTSVYSAFKDPNISRKAHLGKKQRLFGPEQSSNRRHSSRFAVKAEDLNDKLDFELPTRLNNTPHGRDLRKFFYKDVSEAVFKGFSAGEKRLAARCTIAELNPELDVFRIGTLLELCRDIATTLAQDGQRVKVCVQQAMGEGVFQGLPLSLSGVKRIMENMDWGDAEDFITLGSVGAEQIDDSQFYVIIAPQSTVGQSIVKHLLKMVDVGEQKGKQIVLVNPILKDIPSAGNVMQVRGRKERMDFADSFKSAYHFRPLYLTSAMTYPILGAMRMSYGQPWQVFKRIDLSKNEEEYRLVGEFNDNEPAPAQLTPLFKPEPAKKWKTYYNP